MWGLEVELGCELEYSKRGLPDQGCKLSHHRRLRDRKRHPGAGGLGTHDMAVRGRDAGAPGVAGEAAGGIRDLGTAAQRKVDPEVVALSVGRNPDRSRRAVVNVPDITARQIGRVGNKLECSGIAWL